MLIADFELPHALVVPHLDCDVGAVLESLARAASREVGVLLLSDRPRATAAFVAGCPHPERMAVVAAPLDTPWVRDRSPIAVRRPRGLAWLQPRPHMPERARDAILFPAVAARPPEELGLILPQGNLVAGPGGLAVSSRRLLEDNAWADGRPLAEFQGRLGITRWLLHEPLPQDPIAHADYYVRFLGPGLAALLGDADLRGPLPVLAGLEEELREALPGLEIIYLPHAQEDGFLASPLNWIQLGRVLLIPRLASRPLAPDLMAHLRAHGLEPVCLPAPPVSLGGSLHCLTASVFAA